MTWTLFTDSELATILHGLRMIQCEGRLEGCAAGDCEHFDEAPALTNDQIDELCEKINLDGIAWSTDHVSNPEADGFRPAEEGTHGDASK